LATASDLSGTTTVTMIDAGKPTQAVAVTVKCP